MEARTGLALVAVFLVLATCLLAGGWLYYRHYERDFRAEAGRRLSAIARLKVNGLVQYRKERLEDANLFHDNYPMADLVRRFLGTADPDARRKLQTWLGKYATHFQYDQALLLDPQGAVRLAAPESHQPVSAIGMAGAAECLRTGQVLVLDFFRHERDQRVYLDVLTPIYDAADGHRPLGVVVLRIDPATNLYPLVQRWPVPSATAETLLVRRDGNEVVFLNDLRYCSDAALNLRKPLSDTDLPAAAAALGREGIIMEGRDYRGQPVLAALQAVPDSPWFLVAKVDTVEVFESLRAKLWQVLAAISLLLVSAGACIGLVWRQHSLHFYKDRVRAADLLRESEENHRRLIENLPSSVVVHAADSTLLYANPMAASFLGLTADELRGRTAHDPVWHFLREDGTPLPAAEFPFNQVLASGEPLTDLVMGILRPGESQPIWTLSSAYPRRDPSGRIEQVVIHGVNVTERKRAEENLQRTLADLIRSNRELEQFAYIASHDLQEPLRMVASYVQLLAQRYQGRLDDKADKYIHYAVDGAIRMQALIEDLLTYSRVGLRGQPLELASAQAAADEAVQNLSALIEANHARITCEDLPWVRADATQLVLVFQNLIANAVKFRRDDPPLVHVSAHDCQDEWRFAVTDNGIGIEPQHAERVFQIFQRLHTRAEYPGTGIGLAVCQRIVARHGGKIWFESVPGQGTTFFFTVPK